MIRATNSIAVRFEKVVEGINKILRAEIEQPQALQKNVLKKIGDLFHEQAETINKQGGRLTNFSQIQERDNKKLFQLISLYSELATCGVMDGKRKDSLKSEIINLINE